MPGIDFAAVRAAVSMEQVLQFVGFIASARRGPQLRGPCPIHGSQTPQSRSFSVNLSKNAFRCFRCGVQGNQIDLWAQTQRLPLVQAAGDLCAHVNIAIPELPEMDRTHRSSSP